MKTENRNEVLSMQVICNIQAMKRKIYGKAFKYEDFSANTIEELNDLQYSLIPLYNQSLQTNK